MNVITLNLPAALKLKDEEFFELATANHHLKIERTAKGDLIIMPPTGGESGKKNANLTADLVIWNRGANLGVVFDSSTEFHLPLGGDRSPDVSWVKRERWEALSDQQRKQFPPLCPDFVIELRSETDRIKELREKMQEYCDNGMRLGWLIDPKTKKVEIYRQGQDVEILECPATLSGEDVLPGFVLDLHLIFDE